MKETITSLFNDYTAIIILFHIMSAVIWVGGMIAIRFAVHNAMQNIEEPKLKLKVVLTYLDTFFKIVRPLIGLLLVTAVFMTIGFSFKGTPLSMVAHTKEGIWTIMTIIFIIINLKKNTAQRYYDSGDFKSTKDSLSLIAMYLIPANIILGIIAIYLGITLRGF